MKTVDESSTVETAHPEAVNHSSLSGVLSTSEVDYWIRQRSEARSAIGRESHVANNLSLQIPAQQGPAIAVASVVAVSFSNASGVAGLTVLVSAFLLICAAGLSFYLLFRKYNLIVSIVDHVDEAKIRFARGEIPLHEMYYTHGHLFQGLNRILIVGSAILYLLGIFGIAVGFAIHFLTLLDPALP